MYIFSCYISYMYMPSVFPHQQKMKRWRFNHLSVRPLEKRAICLKASRKKNMTWQKANPEHTHVLQAMSAMEWWVQAFSRENDVGEGEMHRILNNQMLNDKWMFGEIPIFHVKIWFIIQLKPCQKKNLWLQSFQRLVFLLGEGLQLTASQSPSEPCQD